MGRNRSRAWEESSESVEEKGATHFEIKRYRGLLDTGAEQVAGKGRQAAVVVLELES